MADNAQPSPSTANIAAACAILAGVTGYMIGQAKSLGFFGGSPIFEAAQPEKEKADDSEEEEEDSSDSEDDDSTPAEFPGHDEECKMVLVVRTDLGMTRGTFHSLQYIYFPTDKLNRQDRRTVRTRDTGLLQALPPPLARLEDPQALGSTGSSKGGIAGQERGGAGVVTSASTEPGAGRTHYPRCGTDTDRERECDGLGYWACAQERH
jgi:hypothetical protein